MTRRSFPLALLALMLFTLPFATACEKKGASSSPAASWSSIPPDKASAMLNNGAIDLALDVRTSGEFASGALPKAMNISVDALASQVGKIADYKDKTVLVYCRSGSRSVTASKFLAAEGFSHVLNMSGGTTSWSQQGLPLVK